MKLRRALTLVATFAVAATSVFARSDQEDEVLRSRIDAFLSESTASGFSGSVLVARSGELLFSGGYGFSDRGGQIPVTPATVFDIGSNTKQFTAAAILKLVELERLQLAGTLGEVLDGVPEDKVGITIHQLLTHSSGIRTYSGSDFEQIALPDFLEEVFGSELLFPPGTSYKYSNVGYSILAAIVERTSGQPFESFLRQHLFDPAGLKQTGYVLPEWSNEQMAHGYRNTIEDLGVLVERYVEQGVSWHLKGNGGIHSTTEDLFKWHLALRENTVLPATLGELLVFPHVVSNRLENKRYGYGWAVLESSRKTRIAYHNGANPLFFSEMIWSTEEDVFVAYCTNARDEEVEKVAWEVQRLVFEPDHEAEPVEQSIYSVIWSFSNARELGDESFSLRFGELFDDRLTDSNVLNRIGLLHLKQGRPDLGVALLEINVDLFPGDGNLWDSLGELYLANEQREPAVKSFERALELRPETDCFWCENSTEKLKTLAAEAL